MYKADSLNTQTINTDEQDTELERLLDQGFNGAEAAIRSGQASFEDARMLQSTGQLAVASLKASNLEGAGGIMAIDPVKTPRSRRNRNRHMTSRELAQRDVRANRGDEIRTS